MSPRETAGRAHLGQQLRFPREHDVALRGHDVRGRKGADHVRGGGGGGGGGGAAARGAAQVEVALARRHRCHSSGDLAKGGRRSGGRPSPHTPSTGGPLPASAPPPRLHPILSLVRRPPLLTSHSFMRAAATSIAPSPPSSCRGTTRTEGGKDSSAREAAWKWAPPAWSRWPCEMKTCSWTKRAGGRGKGRGDVHLGEKQAG